MKEILYKMVRLIQILQVKTAKGWRKTYLSYLTPPGSIRDKWFDVRFPIGEVMDVLEREHPECLRFPFARLFYKIDFFLAALILGISGEYYFQFLFYNHNWKYRRKHITSRRLLFIRDNLNKPEARCYLDDKMMFANHWHDFFGRKICSLRDSSCSRESFAALFRDCGKIIVKPQSGRGGKGIRVMEVGQDPGEIYDRLIQEEEPLIVEEYIHQTGLVHSFNPSSLNTLRVITLRDDTEVTIVSAYLRIGGAGAIVDNLHSGGVGYTVYQGNGKIYPGITMEGKIYSAHPDTGVAIAGQTIPGWEEVRKFCADAHRIAPEGLDYIGWDVCICEDRLYMIEGNGYPGAAVCVEDLDLWKTICSYFNKHPERARVPKW